MFVKRLDTFFGDRSAWVHVVVAVKGGAEWSPRGIHVYVVVVVAVAIIRARGCFRQPGYVMPTLNHSTQNVPEMVNPSTKVH